jgi:hypothetical protein
MHCRVPCRVQRSWGARKKKKEKRKKKKEKIKNKK